MAGSVSNGHGTTGQSQPGRPALRNFRPTPKLRLEIALSGNFRRVGNTRAGRLRWIVQSQCQFSTPTSPQPESKWTLMVSNIAAA
jgi:hypothetical protein